MSTLPIVTVVGYSNAGKTRCVVALITELVRRGYRIASAKHCSDGFDLDMRGKDSWKHKQAGAVTTVMSCSNQVGVVSDLALPMGLAEMGERFAQDADLLLAEGYSWERFPRILVMSGENLADERVVATDLVFALVSDRYRDGAIPCFTFSDMDELASLIECRFLNSVWRQNDAVGIA